MAGAQVLFKLDDHELRDLIARTGDRIKDLKPVMKNFGKYMELTTKDRFRDETSPYGKKWAALDPDYEAWKKQQPSAIDKILQMDGYLILVHAEPDKSGLTLESNRPYAAIHQKGGTISKTVTVREHLRKIDQAFGKPIKKRSVLVKAHSMQMNTTIKARPFLGFSNEDIAEFQETLKGWLLLGTKS